MINIIEALSSLVRRSMLKYLAEQDARVAADVELDLRLMSLWYADTMESAEERARRAERLEKILAGPPDKAERDTTAKVAIPVSRVMRGIGRVGVFAAGAITTVWLAGGEYIHLAAAPALWWALVHRPGVCQRSPSVSHQPYNSGPETTSPGPDDAGRD